MHCLQMVADTGNCLDLSPDVFIWHKVIPSDVQDCMETYVVKHIQQLLMSTTRSWRFWVLLAMAVMWSAKSGSKRFFSSILFMHFPCVACFIIQSMASVNRREGISYILVWLQWAPQTSHCSHLPFWLNMCSCRSALRLTHFSWGAIWLQDLPMSWYADIVEYFLFPVVPYDFRIFQSHGMWTLLKAMVKFIKLIARGTWYSPYFSMICLNVKICSAQKHVGWKPCLFFPQCIVHSVRYSVEDDLAVGLSWVWQQSNSSPLVTPCKVSFLWDAHHFAIFSILWDNARVPYLTTETTHPIDNTVPSSIFEIMPMNPGDLLFFRLLMALLVSSTEKSSASIGSIWGGSSTWAWLAGSGLKRTSLKCLAHLASLSLPFDKSMQSFAFIGFWTCSNSDRFFGSLICGSQIIVFSCFFGILRLLVQPFSLVSLSTTLSFSICPSQCILGSRLHCQRCSCY